MKKADIEYTTNGLFVSLFPCNRDAELNVWNVINNEFKGAEFSVIFWPSIKLQIESAGYKVRKSPKRKMVSDKELLSELGISI